LFLADQHEIDDGCCQTGFRQRLLAWSTHHKKSDVNNPGFGCQTGVPKIARPGVFHPEIRCQTGAQKKKKKEKNSGIIKDPSFSLLIFVAIPKHPESQYSVSGQMLHT
jgi:hypothetical protein